MDEIQKVDEFGNPIGEPTQASVPSYRDASGNLVEGTAPSVEETPKLDPTSHTLSLAEGIIQVLRHIVDMVPSVAGVTNMVTGLENKALLLRNQLDPPPPPPPPPEPEPEVVVAPPPEPTPDPATEEMPPAYVPPPEEPPAATVV